MSMNSDTSPSSIIPTMRYKEASAAIDWLCKAFGFQRHLVVPGEDGTIAHAQLVLGNGMIMLGSVRDGEYDRLVTRPDDIAGTTQAPYVVVEQIDAHYETAKSAGAEILIAIEDQPHGGRAYTCRDPGGHVWNFGSYDPWQ